MGTSTRTTLLSSSFSLALALGASLGTTACQGEPGSIIEDPICLSDSCEDEPSPPISGNAIVDCWVTEAGSPGADQRFDVLDCRYEPPIGYPATLAGATVSGLSGSGDRFSGEIGSAQAGEILSMAHIDPSAYPIELQLDIRFDNSDQRIPALEGLDKVTTKIMVQQASDIAADRPVSAHIPFDLWEVQTLGRDERFSALSFGYPLDIGAGRPHNVAFKTDPLLFGRSKTLYLPVDVNTFAIDARMAFDGGDTASAVITGPGTYAVKEGGLVRAGDLDLPQLAEGGSALANCWFDTADHGFEKLYCQGIANHGVEVEGAMIEINTDNGKTARSPVTEVPTLIATISPEAFPVDVSMVAPVQEGIIGLSGLAGRSLRATLQVSGKDLPRAISRESIRAPFAVWEVTVDNQSEGFQGVLDTYVLELGAGMNDRFATLVDDAETPFVEAASVASFSVASPIGALEVAGNGFMLVGGQAKEVEFVLRPGTLVVGE